MLRKTIIVVAVIIAAIWISSAPAKAGGEVHTLIVGVYDFLQHAAKGS